MNTNLYDLPAEELDRYSGIKINKIEMNLLQSAKSLRPEGDLSNLSEILHSGNQTWVGLDPQTLNTPYVELIKICDLLSPGNEDLIIDLGAGYGRLGLVLDSLYPKAKFIGYEFVHERVVEGNRNFFAQGCLNAELIEQDLMSEDFILPKAQFYFIYDFGKTSHIRKTLALLEELADKNHHFSVVARGKGTRSIIDHEHPWLSSINDVHREKNFSIYSY